MANTYTLIASNTLSTSAASVTFSAIPNTFTDLVVRINARSDSASATSTLRIELNADATSLYSQTILRGDGSTASSLRGTGTFVSCLINAATAVSNTFASVEIYIPSYTASQNKTFSTDNAAEDNLTLAYRQVNANLYRSNTAISEIRFFLGGSVQFVSGSSFFLYGIKNS